MNQDLGLSSDCTISEAYNTRKALMLKKLHELAHELGEQREELGFDEKTILRMLESKAE